MAGSNYYCSTKPKCFKRNVKARADQIRLNQIRVGKVLTVDDQIKARLVTKAMMYIHQMLIPKRSPGIIIKAFVIKAKNSTVLGRFQYFLCLIVPRAYSHSFLNAIMLHPCEICL